MENTELYNSLYQKYVQEAPEFSTKSFSIQMLEGLKFVDILLKKSFCAILQGDETLYKKLMYAIDTFQAQSDIYHSGVNDFFAETNLIIQYINKEWDPSIYVTQNFDHDLNVYDNVEIASNRLESIVADNISYSDQVFMRRKELLVDDFFIFYGRIMANDYRVDIDNPDALSLEKDMTNLFLAYGEYTQIDRRLRLGNIEEPASSNEPVTGGVDIDTHYFLPVQQLADEDSLFYDLYDKEYPEFNHGDLFEIYSDVDLYHRVIEAIETTIYGKHHRMIDKAVHSLRSFPN